MNLKSLCYCLKYSFIRPSIVLDRVLSRGALTQVFCLTLLVAGTFGCLLLFADYYGVDFVKTDRSPITAIAENQLSPFDKDETATESSRPMTPWDAWDVFTESIDMNQDLREHHRWWAVLFRLAGTILFGGILISTISNIIDRRVEKWLKGLVTYSFFGFPYFGRFLKKHYVIIGNGEEIVELVESILEGEVAKITDGNSGTYEGEAIIILTNEDVETLREHIFANLKKPEDEWNIFFVYGDLEFEGCLKKSYPERAKMIFVLGDCDKKFGRDVRNLSCMASLGEIIKKAHGREPDKTDNRTPVFVQFDGIPTYGIIQKLDHFTKKNSWIDSHPFNLYENWSRLLWGFYGKRRIESPASDIDDGNYFYRSLDYRPITSEDSPDYVRLVVMGLGQMGQALVLEALRICHYANYRKTKKKTKVTIIDQDLNVKHMFESQHPYLKEQIYDIDIEFITDSAESPVVRNKIKEWASDKNCLLTIAVCFSDPDLALATGLNLPEEVYEHRDAEHPDMKESGNTVLIRQLVYGEIGRCVDNEKERYKYVSTFGSIGKEFDAELLRDKIPMLINGLYDPIVGSMRQVTSITEMEEICKHKADEIKEKWTSLREYLRWSNRFQADSYRVFLDYLGFTTRKIPATHPLLSGNREQLEAEIKELADTKLRIDPESIIVDMEHRRWVAERTIAGFKAWKTNQTFELKDTTCKNEKSSEMHKTFTTEKDTTYRLHTCIRPTEDLLSGNGERVCLNDCIPISNMPYLLTEDGYRILKKTSDEQ